MPNPTAHDDEPDSQAERIQFGFDDVRRCEEGEITRRRRERDGPQHGAANPIGLALSGGGIRSAAVSLGVIQALYKNRRFDAIDYLSTVSGGGYIGASLSAAMCDQGGGAYPFGGDVEDSEAIKHIRNYSNFLLPRRRSSLANWGEIIVLLLRGWLANAICVLAFLLPAILATRLAFDDAQALAAYTLIAGKAADPCFFVVSPDPRVLTVQLTALLAVVLLGWAAVRSHPPILARFVADTHGPLLRLAFWLFWIVLALLFVELQPFAIAAYYKYAVTPHAELDIQRLWTTLAAVGGAISGLAGKLGKFLETSKRARGLSILAMRFATRLLLFLGALILPLLLWLGYVAASAWALGALKRPEDAWLWLGGSALACWLIMLPLRANGYSLHRLYRDKLSKAFLFRIDRTPTGVGDVALDTLKLSELRTGKGPYPLINAALNVQGSEAANQRGRDADFFCFTPHFVGSELTDYVDTARMEKVDPQLDVATAVAISGAAVSANMGGNTVRLLSPTLSLLNIRLGYYLANPRYVRDRRNWLYRWYRRTISRFYLLLEMFNGLTEKRADVYLTDGGHIENLGIYALLQRRCRLIIAVDAEADPEIGCEALMRVERYARIDLGIRIIVPWEQIRAHNAKTSAAIPEGAPCDHGPHIAIGTVIYGKGEPNGYIVFVKSSLTGDEKDYVLDYALRNPSFPHETTGDQFFSEEQFEMYRALGFHMLDGLFERDTVAFPASGEGRFASEDEARAKVIAILDGASARAE